MFNDLVRSAYHNPIMERLFHTTVHCLKTELNGCESGLDLGCGPQSPLSFCAGVKHSVCVEPFSEYLVRSKKRKIHNRYICKRIEDISFPKKSFDAVIMIEVLEHLDKNSGLEIIQKANEWARKKVIITTPNGFVPQANLDQNPWQRHRSGWLPSDFRKLGFRVYGLSGLKCLRSNGEKKAMDNDLMASIAWRPKPLWFVVSTLSQLFTYYYPQLAFGTFNVKDTAR